MEVSYISTFKAIKETTPYAALDELLELNIDDDSIYRLNNVIRIPGTYTFSIWCKTNNDTTITLNVLGEKTQISSDTNWQKIVKTVTVDAVSESNNYIEIDLERGIIGYFYEAYLAEGKSDTSWSPAPEDIDNNMYQIKSEFNQKADEISGKVSDIDGNVSNVTQRVDNITQRVQTAEGDISALEITAGQIKTDVSNVKGDISTLKQTAEGLQTDVSNAKGDISELKQTASGLSTQVESMKGDISRIDQKADKINISVGEVSEKIDNLEVGSRNLIRNSKTLIFQDYILSDSNPEFSDNGDGNVIIANAALSNIDEDVVVSNSVFSDNGNGDVTIFGKEQAYYYG